MRTALNPFWVVALVLAVPLTCVKWSAATQSKEDSRKTLTPAEFRNHMKQLADAWNSGDARAAVDLFAEDALYSSPPSARIHNGRQELFEWFGAPMGVQNQCKWCGTISFSTKSNK